MSRDDAKSELEQHIERFPSKFDNTSIAGQLRAIDAPIMLYADVRDRLWIPLIKERKRSNEYPKAVNALMNELYDTWYADRYIHPLEDEIARCISK